IQREHGRKLGACMATRAGCAAFAKHERAVGDHERGVGAVRLVCEGEETTGDTSATQEMFLPVGADELQRVNHAVSVTKRQRQRAAILAQVVKLYTFADKVGMR